MDDQARLEAIMGMISKISERIEVVFPCHPRTKKSISKFRIGGSGISGYRNSNINIVDPMSYLDFMTLVKNARFIMTDSGGLQVETSYLNIPCLTLRENTERHDTIVNGSNTLISVDNYIEGYPTSIFDFINAILDGQWRQSSFKSKPIHDGKAAERIVEILKKEVPND